MNEKAKSAPLRGSRAKVLVLVLVGAICVLIFLLHKEKSLTKHLVERKGFLNQKIDEGQTKLRDCTEKIVALNQQVTQSRDDFNKVNGELEELKKKFAEKEKQCAELEKKLKETEEAAAKAKATTPKKPEEKPATTKKPA